MAIRSGWPTHPSLIKGESWLAAFLNSYKPSTREFYHAALNHFSEYLGLNKHEWEYPPASYFHETENGYSMRAGVFDMACVH